MISWQVRENLERIGVRVEKSLLEKVEEYDQTLLKWNRKINLTGLKTEEERAMWLYSESIWAAVTFPVQGGMIDVGCGCGFPGLAFHWVNQCKLTLIEQKEKKVHFLKEAVRRLEMKNVTTRNQTFDGYLGFYEREKEEQIGISWRALCLNRDTIQKMVGEMRNGDSAICFLGKDSRETDWVGQTKGLSVKKRKFFPLSEHRFVIQMVKCST